MASWWINAANNKSSIIKRPRAVHAKKLRLSVNSTPASAVSRPSNFECIYILSPRQKRIIIVERQTKISKWRRKGVSRQSKRRGKKKAKDHRHLRAIPTEANLCNCFHARQGQGFPRLGVHPRSQVSGHLYEKIRISNVCATQSMTTIWEQRRFFVVAPFFILLST